MNKTEKAAFDMAQHDANLSRLKLRKMREKTQRKMDGGMLAAYHLAKGLSELLAVLDDPSLAFHAHDAACIREAHRCAVDALSALDRTVIDYGNGKTQESETL